MLKSIFSRIFKKFLRNSDVSPQLLLERAIHLTLGGDVLAAQHVLDQIIAQPAPPIHAFFVMSNLHQQRGKLKSALELIDRVLEVESGNALYHHQKGAILQQMGQLEGAITCYRTSLQIDATQKTTALQCAQLLEATNQLDEALVVFRRLVKEKPELGTELADRVRRLTYLTGGEVTLSNNERSVEFSGILAHAQRLNWKVHKVSPSEQVIVVSPKKYGCAIPISLDLGEAWTNCLYVAELENVQAWSQKTLLLHPTKADDVALTDILAHPRGDNALLEDGTLVIAQRKDKLLLKVEAPSKLEEKGIMLFGDGSSHYGHWIYDFLPNLKLLDSTSQYQNWPIYIDEGMPASHLESLRKVVGIGREIRMISTGSTLAFKKLVFLSKFTHSPMYFKPSFFPSVHEGLTSKIALDYLSQKLSHPATGDRPRERLYLSRKSSTWRKLLNEDEVERFFIKLGFRSVAIETLGFEEMLDLLSNASYVAGPSGSAMNNVIFAPLDCPALILSPPQLGNYTSWATVITQMGRRVAFHCGSIQDGEADAGKHSNFSVDLDLLKETMDRELK